MAINKSGRKLHIEVVTPYDIFYEGAADMIILPAIDGEIGVLPGHSPMIVSLTPGEMRIKKSDEIICAAISDGYAQIELDSIIVVIGSAELPENIDAERAERALHRARNRIADPFVPQTEKERSAKGVLRATARLKVVRNHVNKHKK